MKRNILHILLGIALLMTTVSLRAQQVTTLYFLENAPMRHIVNPALQPVSNGYINFSPLGYTSFWAGNNSLTLSDFIYIDPQTGTPITALHPNGNKQALLKTFRKTTLMDADATIDLLSFGFRIRENGYFHFGAMIHGAGGVTTPRGLYNFALGGGMTDLNGGINSISLSPLGADASIYTEIGAGYSHKINEQWTVGGKLKFLMGTAYMGLSTNNLNIDASATEWRLHGDADIVVAAPLQWESLPEEITRETLENMQWSDLLGLDNTTQLIRRVLHPSGYGAAVDLGFTYKPVEQVQITAAINDLGFIYWGNSQRYTCAIDTTYTGTGEFNYSDYVINDKFNTDSLMRDVTNNMLGLLNGIHTTGTNSGFARMLNARFNVGVDANFWENRIGIGVLSSTRLHNSRLYEEVTLGAALRPCNWFNLALSYSLVNNGKYSNLGAGISIMPYDGINLTFAMDYIPTSYAYYRHEQAGDIYIPYKSKGVNLAAGVSIVWGTNKKPKDSDKDGVFDKLDMCPNTPANVRVDDLGCPLDTDGDGVPDYLDQCPTTPSAAYGLVDSVGCPIDSDQDGVPDYLDKCPDTPEEARNSVDDKGCPLDTDRDGVPDYLDQCPGTPAAAEGLVDSVGCPLDTDGDGVPDYIDRCPNTPAEAYGLIDEYGCPLDTDKDGVPDYLDKCPDTPKEAYGRVDTCGCPLDTDGDGVPDYLDECPTVPGSKANKGCPEVKREVRNLLRKAMQGIQFENGKATIKKSSYPILNQIAKTFIDNPTYRIEVQGHTDNVGNHDFNVELSERRAYAVRTYLVKQGVPSTSLTAHGYGPDKPIADNKTKAGRAQNRRVEFDITFEEVTYELINDRVQPADTIAATQPADSAAVAPAANQSAQETIK